MGSSWIASFVMWTVFSSSTVSSSIEGCPKSCFCNALSKIVYCSRRGLALVPDTLPVGTLELNLNGNTFRSRSLHRSNFSRHVTLEHLYLSDCGIEAIEVDTFTDLTSLKWLDMSDNRLKTIQASTFRGLRLQHLFLNGNEGIRLLATSFDGLVTTGLYLHDCGLTDLAPEVLVPLNGTLGTLWLNGNQLDRIDPLLQTIFASLSHIRLASNPLRCNCEAVWLKEFYDKNSEVFREAEAPGCSAPQRLKGRHFGQLSLFDFRCQSPAFSNIDAFFGNAKGQLRCAATGDPTPSLYWIQPSGKAIKFDPPQAEEANRNEGVLVLEAPNPQWDTGAGSGMSGMYICIANNEAGNATLTINVTWPHLGKSNSNNIFQHYHNNHVLLPPSHHHPRPRPFQPHPDVAESPTTEADDETIRLGERPGLVTPISGSPPRPRLPNDHYVLLKSSVPPGSMSGPLAADRQPLFTLTELALSVVGTHFATILLTVGCLSIYHWTRKVKTNDIPAKNDSILNNQGDVIGGAGCGGGGVGGKEVGMEHHQHQLLQRPGQMQHRQPRENAAHDVTYDDDGYCSRSNGYEVPAFHGKFSADCINDKSDLPLSTQYRVMKR